MGLDEDLYLAVQHYNGTPVLDSFMVYSAELFVFLVPIALISLWYIDEEYKDALYVFMASVAGIAISYVMGLFYSHPPPITVFTSAGSGVMENAFPSQHTTAVFGAAFGFLWRERWRYGAVLTAAGALTGLGRVFIGEHWPLDILGGIVAGWLGMGLILLTEGYWDGLFERIIAVWKELEERTITIPP